MTDGRIESLKYSTDCVKHYTALQAEGRETGQRAERQGRETGQRAER